MMKRRCVLVSLMILGSGAMGVGCGRDPDVGSGEPGVETRSAPLVESCTQDFDPVAFCRNLAGFNAIIGTSNNDVINGTNGPDCIVGLGGQDTINGNGGDDIIFAGDGDDVVHGGAGNDQIFGGSGQDQLFGDAGDDIIFGEDGDDRLFGGDGNDRLSGGTGQDRLSGDNGNDQLAGDDGDDQLTGGAGNDSLDDCLGHNTFNGGTETNTCRAPTGSSLTACTTVISCAPPASGPGSQLLGSVPGGANELVVSDTDVFVGNLTAIVRVAKTGGPVTTFIDAFNALGFQRELGLSLDRNFLYWTAADIIVPTRPNTLFQASLANGNSTVMVQNAALPLRFPQSNAGSVYYGVLNSSLEDEQVQRVPVSGAPNVSVVLSGAALLNSVRPYLVSCSNLFFTDFQTTTTLLKVRPLAGGAATTLAGASGQNLQTVQSFDVDTAFIYFTAGNQIMRAPIAGGPTQLLATDPTGLYARLVVDDQNVYALSNELGPSQMFPGPCVQLRVQRVAKAGGPLVNIEQFAGMCGHDIVLDQTSLYWTQTTDFFALGPGQVRARGK